MKNVFSGKNRIFFLLGFGLLLLGLAAGIWLGAGQKARNVQQFQEKLLLQAWEMDSRIHQLLMTYTAQLEQGTGDFPWSWIPREAYPIRTADNISCRPRPNGIRV